VSLDLPCDIRDDVRQRADVRPRTTRRAAGTRETDLSEVDAIEGATGEPARQTMDSWIFQGGHPLREKLTLFWHNHFATSIFKVRNPGLMFRQNCLLRQHALGKGHRAAQQHGRRAQATPFVVTGQHTSNLTLQCARRFTVSAMSTPTVAELRATWSRGDYSTNRASRASINLLADGKPSRILERCLRETAVCGIMAVAESVEDARALPELRALGIRYAQGFAIYRPQPLASFVEPHALLVA
jgi:hypothetical protein